MSHPITMKKRFRGFLPVVIDVETGGFNAKTDALLEIAAVTLTLDDEGHLTCKETHYYHIEPFKSANLDPKALEFNKIDPFHPFRFAIPEDKALTELYRIIHKEMQLVGCHRAVLVGHNPTFDLSFMKAATARCENKKDPFHPFTTFDTATLAGVALQQTVLARACAAANIAFDAKDAHSAKYDAEKTAELFCHITNQFNQRLPSTHSNDDAEESLAADE